MCKITLTEVNNTDLLTYVQTIDRQVIVNLINALEKCIGGHRITLCYHQNKYDDPEIDLYTSSVNDKKAQELRNACSMFIAGMNV